MRQKLFLAVRADGGVKAGMGHLFKQAILLDSLKSLKNVRVFFFIKEDTQGMQWLRTRGIRYTAMPARLPKSAEPAWMLKKLPGDSRGLFVLDILDVGGTYIRSLKQKGARVVTLENRSQGRKAADAAVNAIVEGPQNAVERSRGHVTYRGGRYRVFHRRYSAANRRQGKKALVLVTFGGGDDKGLTIFAGAEVLKKIPSARVAAVEGPAQRLKSRSGVRVIKSPVSLADVLAGTRCVLTAGGGTLYEAALLGVPAVAFAKRAHQRRNIRYFARLGTALDGGVLSRLNVRAAADKVRRIWNDRPLAGRMAKAGKRLVDGKGAARVTAILKNELKRAAQGGRR